ncbi:MAG: hypothetical protein CMF12_01080 [Idiomarina sp.]|uniref:conjugative transfer system coupling protein TraD n=1 Tax=Idiomarina sp. TaxID=1874361 RepID=UPI000C69BB7C|nr:conjugative transfer system coupling protein TraD [Idiomarina sp.]MBT41093.1 hypothetical protein [Idiomarina sp.]
MNKQNPSHVEHVFRPIHELSSAYLWIFGAVAMPIVSHYRTMSFGSTTTLSIAGAMFLVGLYFLWKSIPLMKRQIKLSVNRKEFIDTNWLRKKNDLFKRMGKKEWKKDPRELYLGNGFEWGSEHAQRAYQVLDFDSEMSDVQLPFALRPVVKAMSKETRELGGKPWIHGLGNEKQLTTKENTLFGHTIITGNVGTGKTTLLRLLSINALHLGNVLVVIDPKNDSDWKDTIKKEMDYLGIGDQFYFIHPAKQSESARIPLLKNYMRLTEIPSRLAPLMGAQGTGVTFETFAYSAIQNIVEGMRYLGEPIRLTTIQKAISLQRIKLATKVFYRYMEKTFGEEWEESQRKKLNQYGDDLFTSIANYYKAELVDKHPCRAVEGMIEFAMHDQAHYEKMIASFRPVMTALTATPMDDLFSVIDDPANDEKADKRPIVDIESIMERGGCIYLSLDSLTDPKTAGYIARLILAELAAVAGHRYNADDLSDTRRVTIAVDEVHAAIENNDALLNLLAQGRAAQLQMILSTQTIADLESKTDEFVAKRFLGLCNNYITLRTSDPATQEYAASQFSKSSISTMQKQYQSGVESGQSVFSMSSNSGERMQKEREDAFPPTLLKDLPNLQYIARLADGRTVKVRLPILINKDKQGETAPWVMKEAA